MANKALLHKNSLDDFREWLKANHWHIICPQSQHEVLRAWKVNSERSRLLSVYATPGQREHLSILNRDVPLIRQYLKERNEAKELMRQAKRAYGGLKADIVIIDDPLSTLDRLQKKGGMPVCSVS
jgi:hypothetical protein